MTLRAPPKSQTTPSIVGRFVGLIVLLLGFALVVWTAVINQQIPLVETANPLLDVPGEHVVIDGRSIHLRRWGSDDRQVVLLHDDTVAGGATMVRVAAAVAEHGNSVIAPDLVGFGLSSRAAGSGRHYSVFGQAELLASLLDELGTESPQVVGFGWGGSVAAELAVSRPDLVGGLTLVDSVLASDDGNDWARLEGLPFGLGRAISYTFEGASLRAEARFLEGCGSGGWCDDTTVVEGFRRAVKVPGTATSIQARRATTPASVALDRLDALTMPVTIVWSGDDPSEGDGLAGRFGEAVIEVVDGVESRPELNAPDEIAELIG